MAYEYVAGVIDMETEIIGLDWLSIIFLSLRIRLIGIFTFSCKCQYYL